MSPHADAQKPIDMEHGPRGTALEGATLNQEEEDKWACRSRRNGFALDWRSSNSTLGRAHVEYPIS
eukprot:5649414-Pyramimonas_sp.AAC.1